MQLISYGVVPGALKVLGRRLLDGGEVWDC